MIAKGRVLHLIDTPGPGGAETVFSELVCRLPTHGWDSVPVLPGGGWLADSLSASGLAASELTCHRSFDVSYARKLRLLIRNSRIDLVQTHLLGTSIYAALACVGTGIPVVSTFHGRPDIRPSERFRRIKAGLLGRNHVVCVSESLRNHFIGLGDLGEGVQVIPNGVDLRAFGPGKRSALRSELGLADDVPLVGAVGNIRASKAYHVLLDAFEGVRAALPKAHLVVAGQRDADLYGRLAGQLERLGLTTSTHFLGFRDDVVEILSALDVFALSSADEGFSLATVQAMAMGLPVVATRSGGPEEIVGNSEAAILVAPDDPPALSNAIVRLLENRDLASSLGEAARQCASRFSVERMAEGYSTLYDRVLHIK